MVKLLHRTMNSSFPSQCFILTSQCSRPKFQLMTGHWNGEFYCKQVHRHRTTVQLYTIDNKQNKTSERIAHIPSCILPHVQYTIQSNTIKIEN